MNGKINIDSNNINIPDSAKGLSWGGFVLSWIWGIANKTYVALFVFIFPILMNFILLFKGKEWAWKNKKWKNVKSFKKNQLKWDVVGLMICGSIFFASLFSIPIAVSYLTVQLTLQGRAPTQDLPPVSEQISSTTESLEFYKNLKTLRGQTADSPPYMFIAEVEIGYEKGNNAMITEINERASQIHNLILKELASQNASELTFNNIEQLEYKIIMRLNQIMRSGKIKAVLFKELQTFTQ